MVLVALAQADGTLKTRPAVALRQLPGFGDWLICGISTQLQQHGPGFDETLTNGDADFPSSGLARVSLIRLGFLQAVPSARSWAASARFRRIGTAGCSRISCGI